MGKTKENKELGEEDTRGGRGNSGGEKRKENRRGEKQNR